LELGEIYCSIGRSFGDGSAANGHAIHGAIATQLNFSGNSGERIILAAEMAGRNFTDLYDHSATTASNFVPEGVADHMFYDYAWTLDSGAGANSIDLEGFGIQVVNNASPRFYDNQVVQKFIMGMMDTTGNFKISRATTTEGGNSPLDDFIAGTDVLFEGTHVSSKVILTVNAHYTGAPIDPAEEELFLDLAFEGVNDGTNKSITIVAADGIERSIP
jgi:hypothetical protein